MKFFQRYEGDACTYCNGLPNQIQRRRNTMVVPAITTECVKKGAEGQSGDSWEVKIDTITECGKAPAEMIINIDLLAKMKIDALMEKYPNIEWLAYLLGDGTDPLRVVDIFIPKQTVTTTRVDDVECPEFNDMKVIGVIHSHHGMGTGFSGTDHEWINQNHNISLVIAKTGVAGQCRWTTPCGCLKIVSVKVKVTYPDLGFDKEGFIKEGSEQINKKTYNYAGGYQTGQFYDPQGGNNFTPAQRTYVNGVSVKSQVWDTGKEDDDLNSDDEPKYSETQSLKDALDEAFPE